MEQQLLKRLTGFSLALAIIFSGSTVYYANRESRYKRYANSQHERVLSQLLNSINQLETSLEKAQYLPEGALRQTMAADIWKESQLATAALSSLPLGDQRLDRVETYISQVGDYAYYLLRNSAYGRDDRKDWDTLCALCGNAAGILKEVDSMKQQLDTGNLQFSAQHDADSTEASRILRKVNDEFPEYPSLVYDGPYSDHISQRKPKALEGQPLYSQEMALEKAAALMGRTPSELSIDYKSEGQIPCYGFSCGTESAALSTQGGLLLSYTNTRPIGKVTLTAEEAIKKATEYLRTLGLPAMQASYHTTYEAVMTVNFHSYENGVLAYPDLIKVGIALDDGSVVRLDASGFAMNYHDRPTPKPAVDLETAALSVSENLKRKREMLCCIPTTGQNEVLCWEFACEAPGGQRILQYVNCETGQTENILLLIESSNGTLTR